MPYMGDIKNQQATDTPSSNACRPGLDSGTDIAGTVASTAFRVAPLTGAVSGALFTARNVGKELIAGHVGKAAGELVAGAADTAVSIVAGGVAGSAARETVRQGVGAVAGDDNMPQQSDLRRLAGDIACHSKNEPAASFSPVPAPPPKAGKPVVIKQTKVNGWRTKTINIPMHR